jgi:hypothetical protein
MFTAWKLLVRIQHGPPNKPGGALKWTSSSRALGTLLAAACFACATREPQAPQTLSDETLQALRRGDERRSLAIPRTVVPLIGDPRVPTVACRINSTDGCQLLVDLGANVTLLRADIAERVDARVLVDRERGDIILLESISIGGATWEGVVAAVASELDVDGVLGFNVFDELTLTLDYPRREMILEQAPLPPVDGKDVLELVIRDRLPFLPVRCGESVLELNLDTGAAEWMTVPPAWRSRFEWLEAPTPGPLTWNNQTGSQQVERGRLAAPLEIGAHRFEHVEVWLNPDAEDGWLGSRLLQDVALVVDGANRRVAFLDSAK